MAAENSTFKRSAWQRSLRFEPCSVVHSYPLGKLGERFLDIYFIHHVAESTQVSNVIAVVSQDLAAEIHRQFPDKSSESVGERENEHALELLLPEGFNEQIRPLSALSNSYLQAVDHSGVFELAEKNDLVIRIGHRVGQFIVAGAPLVEVWALLPGGSAPFTEKCFGLTGGV